AGDEGECAEDNRAGGERASREHPVSEALYGAVPNGGGGHAGRRASRERVGRMVLQVSLPGGVGRGKRSTTPGEGGACYLMELIPASAFSRSVSEMGAEPAASWAACWPSALTTYARYSLTSSTGAPSAYSVHAMRYEMSTIG